MVEIIPNRHAVFVHFTIALLIVATVFMTPGTRSSRMGAESAAATGKSGQSTYN